MSAVRAVLLDAFGTLVTMEPPAPHLRAELRRRAGLEVSEAEAAAAFRAEIAYYLAHHLEGRDTASLDRLRDRCADVIRDCLGPDRVDRATARAAMLAALRFASYPDAAPGLRRLRERRLKLVVASNWDCSLPRVLERTGLAELVDGVVSSAEVGAAKPDAALFQAALALAGVRADQALYVGDSPANDVEGARSAGIRAALMARDEPPSVRWHAPASGGQAVPRVRELGEVASLI